MHALIVVAHHHPRSLTHALAAHIAEGVVRAGHSAETTDLAAEGFEPRFGLADHAVHRGRTQIDHGIFDYCGARVVRSELLLESESADPAAHLEQARRIGAELFASARRPMPA
ncbi:NAD(P)H-dependent oxidoreductase [Pseudomonas aeruginosa]|uniref:NAD(P)H-dependent oxidoreductase n=1 Tax=Pseudomonas aeruginosa TaxID=287 RepID=UPI0010526094|nr:NAD(P)H-dependent oxidoreductase [Pseudomonas aeruginosa]